MSVVTYRISAMSLIQPAGASGLSDLEFRVLEFEKSWWRYAGAKESAIKELFDRLEGKPVQATTLEDANGQVILPHLQVTFVQPNE